MTEQDYREIKAEVKNSAIPIKSQKMILEACEKQVEKEPINKIMFLECPTCGSVEIHACNYCSECGQNLTGVDMND